MVPDEKAVRAAVDQWFVALNAMLAGDPEPFARLFSHASDVIYMSGEGSYRVGFEAAFADWKNQAAKSLGGRSVGEDVSVIVSGDMAAVALLARATFKTPDGSEMESHVRQTHVFRKEAGAWKMIVHHADLIPEWQRVVGRSGKV